MKLTTLLFTAAICGSALAAPTFSLDDPIGVQYCDRGPEYRGCTADKIYFVCVRGVPSFYNCDGGCRGVCPPGAKGSDCLVTCDNGRARGAPTYREWDNYVTEAAKHEKQS